MGEKEREWFMSCKQRRVCRGESGEGWAEWVTYLSARAMVFIYPGWVPRTLSAHVWVYGPAVTGLW